MKTADLQPGTKLRISIEGAPEETVTIKEITSDYMDVERDNPPPGEAVGYRFATIKEWAP